ncbi:MAG: hypothetical protein KKC68_02030 [Candidatus Thermoplasmatota archaeon]|nr:hypothetical protein [Candidatus Thermoplasmatota archaeon]MBU1940528.1 hypothetical protein [Candidatus Thermoplasmatota archaeon]
MNKGNEILLSVIYLLGEVWGRTYLQKLLFLLNTELFDNTLFSFTGYKYGPFSIEINTAITGFLKENIVMGHEEQTKTSTTAYRYTLTRKGKKLAKRILKEKLSNDERCALVAYTSRFETYTPTDLLLFVYKKYPEYTRYSIFNKPPGC